MPPTTRKKPYPHALDLDKFHFSDLHARELSLRSASLDFRDLPDWTQKLKDKSFVANWLRDRQNADFGLFSDDNGDDDNGDGNESKHGFKDPRYKPLVWGRDDVTMWFNELAGYKHYVRRLQKQGVNIEPDVEAVWRLDAPVGEDVRGRLVDAAATLENIPEDQKLWRPSSFPSCSCLSPDHTDHGGVLDLLDPSMWPIIYGRTINITNNFPIEDPQSQPQPYSSRSAKRAMNPFYSWLPSEFTISPDGKSTKISSYINNLSSPHHEALFYPILEKVFTAFIPLFNHVLAEIEQQSWVGSKCIDPTPWKTRVDDGVLIATRSECMKASEDLLTQLETTGDMKYDPFEGLGVPMGGGAKPEGYADMWPVKNSLRLVSDAIWMPPKASKLRRLEGKTAKVVVAMVNIMLTPEEPEYLEGGWGINGMLNERIIATGVYFYAQENITETHLALRRRNFNTARSSNTTEIEWVRTKENRAIVYPNFYEHRIPSFSLLDRTKPGYSKMLIFHYCDPWELHDLPTTSQILPQQATAFETTLRRSTKLGSLPEEVFLQIIDYLPYNTLTFEQAADLRKDMNERKEIWMREDIGGCGDDDDDDDCGGGERGHYFGVDGRGYERAYSSDSES
ncbi:hypothetical protein TWF730_003268 [Orbilia blumenaviensis]|uniref:F-box domain-containing protein n=1 Tax=Orbilia blumenaviensis TaxID=1796055 RepID=A0AAV9U7X1_9PEZI